MGTNFFWFYDAVLAAVVIGVTFRSLKKGAVGVLISTAAALIAFIAAFFGSGALADTLYERYIAEPLTGSITSSVSDALGGSIFPELGKINMSKAVVSGKFLGSIRPEFDKSGKMSLDLSNIDLTETGIQEADLSAFGIDTDFDYSTVNLGTVEIRDQELSQRSLGDIVLARVLADRASEGPVFSALETVGRSISDTLPTVFGSYGDEVANKNIDALYSLILGITDFNFESYGSSIISGIIDPIVKVPLRAILFLIIFAVTASALNLTASASKIINRIPVISSVNGLLGGILGLVKAALIMLIVCIGIQFLISLTDNSLVFLNTYTIDRTIAFKYIYHFDFIDFLKPYV